MATVARGFGARGYTVRDRAGLHDAFVEALASGETCVIDAKVVEGEMLYPMIQPGSAGVDVVEHPVR
jgi:thiamine pyrophosphate-dependent acetolactate synthase large subunit-like protein